MNEIEKIFFPNEKQYNKNSFENQENNSNSEEFEQLFQEELKKLEPKEEKNEKLKDAENIFSQIEASRNIFNAKHNK